MQSECAKSDRKKIDLRILWPKSSDFEPKSDDLGDEIFKSKNGVASKFKMLSAAASSTRMIDELDDDAAKWRRCFAPDARSAGGASLRGQTTSGWLGLGPRVQEKRIGRAPLRGYVLVDSGRQQQQLVVVFSLNRPVYPASSVCPVFIGTPSVRPDS